MLTYGFPLALSTVPQVLNFRLDQMMMATLLPAELLGYYVDGWLRGAGLLRQWWVVLEQYCFRVSRQIRHRFSRLQTLHALPGSVALSFLY